MDKKDIASYNLEELTQEMKTLGEKPFRARQIYAWLHQKLAGDFQEMTDLSKALRERLEAGYEIRKMEPVAHLISKKDPTEKFLFELADGNQIESVLMKYNYGNSACISSQAGCRMGCRFCASTSGGLNRSLRTCLLYTSGGRAESSQGVCGGYEGRIEERESFHLKRRVEGTNGGPA